MATLTYDPTPADQPEFNEAEQEALAIGEAAAQEQQQLLAGKFRDAEELEKAYIELQSKLGSRSSEETDEQATTDQEVNDDNQDSFFDTLWEQARSGEITEELRQQLSQMDPSELAVEYLQYRNQVESQQPELQEITEEQVTGIRGIVGGDENYQQMIAWASENLSPQEIQMYDSVMAEGNLNAMTFAVHALKARYNESVGVEGQLFKGKPASSTKDVFRSQAEVVQAMSDPRYDRDPAYRQDVADKLERSNLSY